MSEGKLDSSNGAKSRNPEWLCSHIRIKTLHALTIVVAGMLSLSAFFWMEFKELEKEVKEVAMIARSAFSSRADNIVKNDEELQNEIHIQNNE